MALSVAVVLALGYRLNNTPVAARHEIAEPAQKAPSAVEPPKPRPAAIAAVRLPPAPRPAAKPIPLPALKPPPRVEPSGDIRFSPLKPSDRKTATTKSAVIPLKPAASPNRRVTELPESTTPTVGVRTVAPDAVATTEGRVLLRMLEHGTGPAIEIAWPTDAAVRASLYRYFSNCFGLRVAVLGAEGRLYTSDSPPGRPWPLNPDAFSGFMRQHDVSASRQETQELRRIRDVHGHTASGAAVRIFPRGVDAALLGGLQRIVGDGYTAYRSIRARYALRDGRVYVDRVVADGQKKAGRVDLSAAAVSACRGARA